MPLRDTKSAATNGATLSVTLDAGVQVGDTIAAVHADDFYTLAGLLTPTGTAVTTWTLQHSVDNGTDSRHAKVWTGTVTTGGAATVQANSTNTDHERYLMVFVLPSTWTFDDATSTANGAGSASHVAPSATATGTTDYLFCSWWATPVQSNYTAMPGSMTADTEYDVAGSVTFRSAYEQLAGSGATGTRTATNDNAGIGWSALSVLMEEFEEPPATTPTFLRPVQAPAQIVR